MFFRFISYYYIKYFVIIFMALEMFFVCIDTLKYVDELPDSANLMILFLFYDSVYAMSYTLPISLVLGSVMFFIYFLRSNQLTALLALGYSRSQILKPVLACSILIVCAHIAIDCTPLAYAQESAEGIISNQAVINTRRDVLLKFDNKYIFIDKIYPLQEDKARAENIKIFELRSVQDRNLSAYYGARLAFFENDIWRLEDVTYLQLEKDLKLGQKALEKTQIPHLNVLEGFRPKVLDTFSQDKPNVSIMDALDTLLISFEQGTSHTKMRALLYSLVVVPFFVPLCIMLIASFIPSLARYGNLALISFSCIVGALVVWGLFFSFSELSISGLLQPEFGVLLPFGLLCAVTGYFMLKINSRFI